MSFTTHPDANENASVKTGSPSSVLLEGELGKKHLPAQLMIDTALGALARNATSHILRKKIAFHPP
jgi:hypothetical protein